MVADVFSEGTQILPEGDVQTYIASTVPFRLSFRLKAPGNSANQYDIVLDPPLLTSDGQPAAGRIDLTISVIAQESMLTSVMLERPDRLLQLLGLYGDVVKKTDVAKMIRSELSPKLMALDLRETTADELWHKRELSRDISRSLKAELGSAVDQFGLQVDDCQVNWAPPPQMAKLAQKPKTARRTRSSKSTRGTPAKSARSRTPTQDAKPQRESRSAQTRSNQSTRRSRIHMTVLDKFRVAFPTQYKETKSNHTFRLGKGATVYFRQTKAGPNEARIHSKWVHNFPNASRLQSYLERNKVPVDSRPDYKIGPEHADQVITILASGSSWKPSETSIRGN